ncbi:SIS domain-containing protein [Spirosoma sp. KUDC1026]|uniref:D-sedoheptulose-7-phosphate isomerase n=1 Tax=Spirosoma sp. KUDC1026 TaxID=2745947 RepID=UPI00159BC4DE|nr:SIS domain-containing protein [Spirosoma sp. KUDC1026]QKZ14822.1 SIS domain-containing protein [Spirosoma sp. KUDC1026]
MEGYISDYLIRQQQMLAALPTRQLSDLITLFRKAWEEDRQIFVFGNGGSAANASHFITDLSKGASDKMSKRFRGMSLNDNMAWMTALGNDYAYEDIFVRQLMNFAQPGDLMMTMSVSGNSPNLVKAVDWCRTNGVHSVALVGGQRGRLAEMADTVVAVDDTHYGRVEDAHMSICHLICYAFMELNEAI